LSELRRWRSLAGGAAWVEENHFSMVIATQNGVAVFLAEEKSVGST
jgi:hypothetical protein